MKAKNKKQGNRRKKVKARMKRKRKKKEESQEEDATEGGINAGEEDPCDAFLPGGVLALETPLVPVKTLPDPCTFLF